MYPKKRKYIVQALSIQQKHSVRCYQIVNKRWYQQHVFKRSKRSILKQLDNQTLHKRLQHSLAQRHKQYHTAAPQAVHVSIVLLMGLLIKGIRIILKNKRGVSVIQTVVITKQVHNGHVVYSIAAKSQICEEYTCICSFHVQAAE